MSKPPEPQPWGILIESARRSRKLSMREAAKRADISEGWWRQVVKGYQTMAGGGYGIVSAPADTIAKMALAVQVPPDLMETQGGNPEAAAIMRKELAGVEPLDDHRPPVSPAMAEAMEPYHEVIRHYVARARTRYPGQRHLTGAQVFPDSRVDRVTWDRLAPGRSDDLVGWLLASIWQEEAAEAAGERRRSRGT